MVQYARERGGAVGVVAASVLCQPAVTLRDALHAFVQSVHRAKVCQFECMYNPNAPEEEELDSDGEDTRVATDADTETVTCNGA